jgi:CHAT domain-containing protein
MKEYNEIKGYLLGTSNSEEAVESVEKRFMVDSGYNENVLSIEEELIQQYVDGELSPDDNKAFETNFLVSSDRRNKVTFARAFRGHLNSLAVSETAQPKKRFSFAALFSFPKFQIPALAGAAVVLLFSSFLIWTWYANSSNPSRELALLNKAYENARPLESRISELDYARFTKLRGDAPPVDDLALKRATNQIEEKAQQNPSAANLILLGRLYLAKKDFDGAALQLDKVRQLQPGNPEIYNDLGVAYFEKAQLQEDSGVGLKLKAQASENFEKALQIKPAMLEALFNKARCLEAVPLNNQARDAWQEYLKYDSTSRWAEEAKAHLERLSTETSQEMSSDELQEAFLRAASEKKDDEAFRLASQNRELITEQYLPQKLAMSLLDAGSDKRKEIHHGLKYLGELEKKRNQDHFAADMAVFYGELSPEKAKILRKAQLLIREGYALCLALDFPPAVEKFTSARELFLQAGDVIEANTIGTYFIAYSLHTTQHRKEAIEMFKQVDEFSRQKKYEWFSLMNLDWVIGGQAYFGYLLPTDVNDRYQVALKKAESMGDLFMTQKFIRSLMYRDLSVKKHDQNSFAYIQRIFEYSHGDNVSSRQKKRGFDVAVETLAADHFTALSQATVQETIASRRNANDRQFVINAQKQAGNIYTQTGDFSEAEKWLNDAKDGVEGLEEGTRQDALTEILLGLGNLESKRNNYPQAINYYNTSLEMQEKMSSREIMPGPQKTDIPRLLYETRRSRLLAYHASGDDTAVEKDLPGIISFAEEKRKNITDEQERTTFFNYEQEIYDVAIEHEFRANQAEQAFNYAETSNSRSLLDSLQNDTAVAGSAQELVNSTGRAKPLTVGEIREQMPAGVQLLQYAVLNDRVLIWIISRDKFEQVSSEIKIADLENQVGEYLRQLRSPEPQQQDNAKSSAQKLYALLIGPALPYLDKDRQVCLIPNKILFNVPFAALLSANEKYFLGDFVFFYSPSSNVFILSTHQAQEKNRSRNEDLLSVGNPSFDRQQLSGLADLPESAREAKEIAANYLQPQILLSGDATKAEFKRLMGTADVIHFAGHYVAHPESPLFSELVMAKSSGKEEDNFFTNSELRMETLPRTKLVVLSACQTGVEGYYNGEGLIGLSRTFLALKVPLVVASQWSVDSEATAELMNKFHRYRRQENMSTVKALRRAQLEMINAPNERFNSPYYWASFAAFGGYAEY